MCKKCDRENIDILDWFYKVIGNVKKVGFKLFFSFHIKPLKALLFQIKLSEQRWSKRQGQIMVMRVILMIPNFSPLCIDNYNNHYQCMLNINVQLMKHWRGQQFFADGKNLLLLRDFDSESKGKRSFVNSFDYMVSPMSGKSREKIFRCSSSFDGVILARVQSSWRRLQLGLHVIH